MSFNTSSIHDKLLQPTPFFRIKLWITIVIITIIILLSAISLSFWYLIRRRPRRPSSSTTKQTIRSNNTSSINRRFSSGNGWDKDVEKMWMFSDYSWYSGSSRAAYNERSSDGNKSNVEFVVSSSSSSRRKLCFEYSLKEIDGATNGFSGLNIIGSGDYGVVYHGVLVDNAHIAVKKLLVNRGRFKDFKGDVEAMWCIRHKNLVKLFGFCTEGTYRMLVYEYVDNGNLKQWLHQSISKISPLTWNFRMKIIHGIAKGLVYLHEDTEPAIIHQHLKASNILLDKNWNPKLSDFGISNFIGPEWSHPMAPPMGMSGYLAPEFAEKGLVDVKSDVYSFGILVMEIVSGRSSVHQSGNEIEEYLIDWMRSKYSEEKWDEIVDPKLPQIPPRAQLERIVKIAFKCVDPDAGKRPKMSDIIHMLEPRDLLLSDEKVLKKAFSRRTSSGSLSNTVGSFGNQSNTVGSFGNRSNTVGSFGNQSYKVEFPEEDISASAPLNHVVSRTHSGIGKK